MWNRSLCCATVALLTAWGCNRGATNETPQYVEAARRAEAGVVAPLADDTSDDIRSWVDGQVVTDWAMEIARRDHAIQG